MDITDDKHVKDYMLKKDESFYREMESKGYKIEELFDCYLNNINNKQDAMFIDYIFAGNYENAFEIKTKDDFLTIKYLICPENLSPKVLAVTADYAVRLAQMDDDYQGLTNFVNSLLATETYINVENGSTKK